MLLQLPLRVLKILSISTYVQAKPFRLHHAELSHSVSITPASNRKVSILPGARNYTFSTVVFALTLMPIQLTRNTKQIRECDHRDDIFWQLDKHGCLSALHYV